MTAEPWPDGGTLYAALLWPSALAAGLFRLGRGPGFADSIITTNAAELAAWVAAKTAGVPA